MYVEVTHSSKVHALGVPEGIVRRVRRAAFTDDLGRCVARASARAAATIPLALAVTACGALSAEPERPTLLTTVTASVSIPATAKSPGVAVVWRPVAASTPGLLTSDELRVAPGYTGALSVPIRRAPPLEAIHRVDVAEGESTAFAFAVGALVAYDDPSPRADKDFDLGAVLAVSRTVYVVWLERPPSAAEARLLADGAGRVPTAGLNFQRLGATGARWLPPSDAYPLLDTGTAQQPLELPERVCSTLYGPVPDAAPASYDLRTTFPPRNAPGLACLSGGRELSFFPCAAVGLCAAAATPCRQDVRKLAPTEELPPGWPCPLE